MMEGLRIAPVELAQMPDAHSSLPVDEVARGQDLRPPSFEHFAVAVLEHEALDRDFLGKTGDSSSGFANVHGHQGQAL